MSLLSLDTQNTPQSISSNISIKDNSGNTLTPIRVKVINSRLSESCTFNATIPIDTTYNSIPFFENGNSIDIYAQTTSSGSGNTTSEDRIFSGKIDHSTFNPLKRILNLSGRDWSANLINYEISGESFLNMTASDAISYLAGQVGLSADIDKTSGFIGQFYQYEHKAHGLSGMHRYQTAWDLCVSMQHEYGYDLWVENKTLYFKKKQENDNIINLQWNNQTGSSNNYERAILDINLLNNQTYSEDIYVKISSWDARQKTVHSAQYPENNSSGHAFNFTAPIGTTTDQCKNLAQRRYNDIMAHGKNVELHLHPYLNISTRQLIKLSGTGTSFDSIIYTVDQVTIEYSGRSITKKAMLRPR
ncbi:hypothetical protein [Acetobacter sp.]|jgi:phage protein D|uniref:hypothetical protein n=1 Tax=Acetobacter sp. TaxID=440 RepID=UPI0025B9C65E|nr:hypothetical protein [Acetobacter sp.]MCH4091411.1 hypothetical protein [Acetobacter sp.]MCI1299389.1 hypothetical protein [Acetobacter sp.]MCI1316607.1 hypothetical protein [Acetobacter sp.]